MYRIKMEVYFDMEGTNAEVVDTVRDYEMRNLVEFDFLDLVFGEPMVRKLVDNTPPPISFQPAMTYELLTEECNVFNN
tara:strand:- start:1566 stop:1799 length:234 start_codon:yes stop_codon:yes gene_type:complete